MLIPVGPTVKTILRPESQERWRSYVAAHWEDWHNYPYWDYLKGRGAGRWYPRIRQVFEDHKTRGQARLSRSARASLFGGRKLVAVQGYVKAACFVVAAARGSGRLHVEFDVPPLSWFPHDQWGIRQHLQASFWQNDEECNGHSDNASHRSNGERFRRFVWGSPSTSGFRTLPAPSPGNVAFSAKPYGRLDMATCHGDTLVVKTMNLQFNEHGRGLEVASTLFYHAIAMGPNIPLLGNLGMWLQELPNPPQAYFYEWAMKLCKREVQSADGGRKDDNAGGATDWFIKDDS